MRQHHPSSAKFLALLALLLLGGHEVVQNLADATVAPVSSQNEALNTLSRRGHLKGCGLFIGRLRLCLHVGVLDTLSKIE